MEVWNPEHPHHAVWREYTQSLLDGKPKVVEYGHHPHPKWTKAHEPGWSTEVEYRIARPMLKLTYEVPMPVTEALERGQMYWLASLEYESPSEITWGDDDSDKHWIRAGLIYLTETDAQAAIDARNAAMKAALEGAK